MPQTARDNSGFIEALSFLLAALGIMVLLGAALGALGMLAASSSAAPAVWSAALLAAGGITAGVILFALAAILRLFAQQAREVQKTAAAIESLRTITSQLEELLRTLTPSDAPSAAGDAPGRPIVAGPPSSEAVLESLEELRGLLLMSEPQRAAIAQQHRTDRKEMLIQQAQRHLGVRDWAAADEALQELAAAFPEEPQIADLRKGLETGRAAGVQQEVAAARERIRHLMSISAWDQAADIAAELLRKYPAAVEAQQMREEIERERLAFDQEFAQRLFLDLSDATEHRRWRRAVEIAEEILRRHPTDRRADKLRRDLATLHENAAAQERKEQEALFKDLLKRQRYQEAIEVANALIHKFPLSPTAAELINLLPKVHDLFHGQQAQRAAPPPP